VSQYNQFTDGRPTGNMLKYESRQCDSVFTCEGHHTVEIHWRLVEVYTARVVSLK
jgi:hypothetical protein